MPFKGFRGSVGGAVQTAYNDQPAVAVPGMVAFASDLNNCDALFVGQADGIAAGRGVKLANQTTNDWDLQAPHQAAFLPESGDAAAVFAGIVIFDEAMQSDENGVPGWEKGRVARVLRPGRSGGRVYVKAVDAISRATATVNLVTIGGTDEKYKPGEFAPAALAGTAGAGTSVAIAATVARWVTDAPAGGVAILELL